MGGGIGIRYTNESLIEPYDYAQAILSALYGLDLTIICEPGRFLVGESGVLLTSVLYEKHNGAKRFVIVDAAMNDLMRPSLYNATHEVCLAKEAKDTQDPKNIEDSQNSKITQDSQNLANAPESNKSLCDVVGPICESSDFLAKNALLPPLKAGDVLMIKNAGAYGASMASNYNTRPRPAEVAFMGEDVRIIKHRESLDDIMRDEAELLQNYKDFKCD